MANVYPAFGGARWAIQHDDGTVQGYYETRELAERAMVPAPATVVAASGIDFLTCTMDDVIARSILLHPTMLQDALTKAYRAHLDAATTMVDGPACRMAHEMSVTALEVRARIASGLLASAGDCHCLTFSQRMLAFGAAYKLQCLPYATAMDIATRGVSAERDND